MADKGTCRDINAKEALECIRGPMTNAEVMTRFKITPLGYADLLKQLYMKKLITDEDLVRRGIRFRTLKKKEAPPPEQFVQLAHTQDSIQEDEQFLDTQALTDLLSLKPPVGSRGMSKKESEKTSPPKEEEQEAEPPADKNKFSITGFFKRAR